MQDEDIPCPDYSRRFYLYFYFSYFFLSITGLYATLASYSILRKVSIVIVIILNVLRYLETVVEIL